MRFTLSLLLLVFVQLMAPAACVEASEPVLRSGHLAAGTRWATPWYEIDSGRDGPVLLITAGMHGNEPAGYRAAEQIRHWPIRRGRLIVVPAVNRLGLQADLRWLPMFRNDPDLRDANRNFPTLESDNTADTFICQELWLFAEQHRPTCVVDLHEGFDFHISNSKSVGSSIIFRESDGNKLHATAMLDAVNNTVSDAERRFVRLGKTGPAEGSFIRSVLDRLRCEAYILETTFNHQPISRRARQHRIMVSTLMQQLGMIDGDRVNCLVPRMDVDVLQVGLYDGPGTGDGGVAKLTAMFDRDPRFATRHLGPADLQSVSLDQFALLVFPGGSGSRQAEAIGAAARNKVRSFVRDGGGYLGICAGAYLCSSHYDWSLNLVDTKVFTGSREIPNVGRKPMWHRGPAAVVKMELTDEGREILGDWQGEIPVRYQNGPIVSPAGRAELPTYLPLAYFRSEVAAWEPQQGTMIHTPAMVAGTFGKGRVIAVSPHPESSEKTQSIINRAADWVARQSRRSSPDVGARENVQGHAAPQIP